MSVTFKCWLITKFGFIIAIIGCIILIAIGLALPENVESPTELIITKAVQWLISPTFYIPMAAGMIISITASIKVGIFTYRNSRQILSHIDLLRKSSVGIFDIQLKYAIKKFFEALFIFSATYCLILVIIINFIIN
jgi:hypothetical protein